MLRSISYRLVSDPFVTVTIFIVSMFFNEVWADLAAHDFRTDMLFGEMLPDIFMYALIFSIELALAFWATDQWTVAVRSTVDLSRTKRQMLLRWAAKTRWLLTAFFLLALFVFTLQGQAIDRFGPGIGIAIVTLWLTVCAKDLEDATHHVEPDWSPDNA